MVVKQVEHMVRNRILGADWITHSFKVIEVLLFAITILVGQDLFACDCIDLDLNACMEVEVSGADLFWSKSHARRPVYVDILRATRRHCRNICAAHFYP